MAESCVANDGRLSRTEQELLPELRRRFDRLQRDSGQPDYDWPNWWLAADSLRLLDLVAESAHC